MNWKVREVAAGEFKAKCLQLMDEVNSQGVELVITKRGKPVAKLVPVDPPATDTLWGSMKDRTRIAADADLVCPDPTDWPDHLEDHEKWW